MAADNISEYDWYESASITGGASLSKDEITLTFAPTRHFSGRRLTGQNTSLWGSWAVQSQQLSVYFSGDGGYSEEFAKIGERFGGFDVAFIEDGAYNQSWRNVHMMPEESAQAGIDVQAKVVLPIHWGKFDLSVHHWREPVRRLKLAFDNYNSTQPAKHRIKVATPVSAKSSPSTHYPPRLGGSTKSHSRGYLFNDNIRCVLSPKRLNTKVETETNWRK
nr:MBL fold metallo-hydrolase [Psychrobacter sp. PraFG1]UNK06318.1 MBL fold metallo-hydrolase [Psychrobacter sp. PraFG1]